MLSPRPLVVCVALTAAVALAQGDLELDLSAPADLESVALLPPTVRLTAKQGGFVGVDTTRTTYKWNTAAHARLVEAMTKELGGKVIPADVTQGALAKAGISAAQANAPEAQAKLARALNVAWLISFEPGANETLKGYIADSGGRRAAEVVIGGAAGIKPAAATAMAASLASKLKELAKQAQAARDAAIAAARPPPVEQVVEEEFAPPQVTQPAPRPFGPQRGAPRLSIAVGPGVVTRGLSVGGEASADLAQLQNGTVLGLGVSAQLQPLHFFDGTKAARWADLAAELHYRRAFVRARGTSGSVQGQTCDMTEDDVQVRGTFRYRFGENAYLPRVGLGAGFSQEQTRFACSLPVVSATYRGVDLQLRVRQALYRDLVSLDVSVGPRFLMGGPDATPAFSVSGEAWIEARPWSVLFARGGARLSRLSMSNAGVSVVDTRGFFALELGAFF
ncbi:MAG: hypothetical protein AB1730_09385 [Myxococcota bacterium]